MRFFTNSNGFRFREVTGNDIVVTPGTTANIVSASAPGFAPKLSGDPNTFFNGMGQYVPATAAVIVGQVGALGGDGTQANPLTVLVDNTTIIINGANKLQATGGGGSGIDQLTGDVTAGPGTGSQAATLANTAVTPGTYGDASNVAQVTVDAKGRLTSVANVPVAGGSGITQLTGDGTAGPGSGSQVLTLANTAATPGTFGSATKAPVITVDAKGRITASSEATITGSGGNVTSTTAFGSEPGSPASGDLDLYTNSFFISRYSGSAWIPWGPIFALTPPVDGDFAWINQGSASVSTTNGGIYLATIAEAAVNLRVRKKAAPSTPYTITAGFLFTGGPNSGGAGICWRQSSDGKLVIVNARTITNTVVMGVYNYTSATVFSATALADVWRPPQAVTWFRITDDGTNRIVAYSADGINFITVFTVVRTSFLTADEVGFFVNNTATNYAIGMTLLSWKQT